MGTQLSTTARWALMGLSLSLPLLLFPPFWYGFPGARGLRAWHFFLQAPPTTEVMAGLRLSWEGAVDFPILFLELLLLWVAMGIAWCVVHGIPQSLQPGGRSEAGTNS
jgi:hypothetical protein